MARRRKQDKTVAEAVKTAVDALCANGTSPAGLVRVLRYDSFEEDQKPSENIVAESQLAAFLSATLTLHFEPGYNPHSGGACSKALCITAEKLETSGPYWWSTPGVQDNGDPDGAVIFHWSYTPTILWVRPGVELPEMFSMHRGYTGQRASFPH